MATLPVVPSFATGETPSIAKLNQLAYCVTFLETVPAFGQFTNTGQSIPNSAATAVSWTKVTDRDGGFNVANPTRYTAQTPGYYQLDTVVEFAANATGNRYAYYQVTTGTNNPGGAGHTQSFGQAAGGTATGTYGLSIGELSPYLYVLDYVEVYVFQASGGALNTAASAWQVTFEQLGP